MNSTRTGTRRSSCRQRLEESVTGFFRRAGEVGQTFCLQRREGRERLKNSGNRVHAFRVCRLHLLLQLLGQRSDIDISHLLRGLLWRWRVQVRLYRRGLLWLIHRSFSARRKKRFNLFWHVLVILQFIFIHTGRSL